MKIYELKEGIKKDATSLYIANQEMFEDIRNEKNVAFKYKDFFYKVVKNPNGTLECRTCSFKGKGHEMYCNNLGVCLQDLVKNLGNHKKSHLDAEVRMAEEYEVIFEGDENYENI